MKEFVRIVGDHSRPSSLDDGPARPDKGWFVQKFSALDQDLRAHGIAIGVAYGKEVTIRLGKVHPPLQRTAHRIGNRGVS